MSDSDFMGLNITQVKHPTQDVIAERAGHDVWRVTYRQYNPRTQKRDAIILSSIIPGHRLAFEVVAKIGDRLAELENQYQRYLDYEKRLTKERTECQAMITAARDERK